MIEKIQAVFIDRIYRFQKSTPVFGDLEGVAKMLILKYRPEGEK